MPRLPLPHPFPLWLGLLAAPALAQDWPHWRGPAFDGSSPATGLPAKFDRETNLRWRADLPGPSAATPIVVGERVFVSATVPEAEKLLALCFDRATGELLWERDAGSGYRPAGAGSATQLHHRSNYASPSPVADGERVIFFYGNGDLLAYDHAGEVLWRRNLQRDHGDFAFQWTFSASPTLWKGLVHLPVLQRDEPVHDRGGEHNASFLLAFDAATGELVYRHERPSDARKESLESYATPIPYTGGGREELLIVGGDVITGHDPATGRELWRWGTWNPGHREIWWRVVPSAVVGGGVVLACAPKRAPVYAVKLGGEGELGEAGLVWASEGRPNPVSSDVPTPLFYGEHFYVLSDVREALSKVDPATGAVAWTVEMPGRSLWRASPTGADGRVFCVNHAGLVVALDAEDGAIVQRAELGEPDDDGIRASVVAAHGCLLVRTHTTLYCFGS